LRKLKADQQLI